MSEIEVAKVEVRTDAQGSFDQLLLHFGKLWAVAAHF